MKTPVALIIFKRPDATKKVFEKIRKIKPQTLLIIADGPRSKEEKELCRVTRNIVEKIDWNCTVLRNYSEINLGVRKRISSGLEWIFSKVDRAIILEDDCIPHLTFFRFCEELLEYYQDDERVMSISGNNLQPEKNKINYSYYFSHNFHLWGWATWKRAFKHYDIDMKFWPEVKSTNLLNSLLRNKSEIRFWTRNFDQVYDKKIDAWGYRWVFSCWLQNGLCILPSTNLVTNIGFDQSATHTKFKTKFSHIPSKGINFPLNHPAYIIRNRQADISTLKLFSKSHLLVDYIKSRIWKFLDH